jgi:thiol-disulfide isomerase/thioredoxin
MNPPVMKGYFSSSILARRVLSVVAVIGAATITTGWHSNAESHLAHADEGAMPDLSGAIGWLNSAPLDRKSLRGKVVLVDFWTYTCINSLRPLPYVKNWAAKYRDAGLVVIGVHTPEFPFEKERLNVENPVSDLKISYPVAIDSNYRIWQAFNNEYWPAQYLIDGKGRIRYHHFGESAYGEFERVIQELLKDNGATGLNESTVSILADGVEAAPSPDVRSPENLFWLRSGPWIHIARAIGSGLTKDV